MLNADRAPYFHTCPRCHEGGYEILATHSHCVNCNYSLGNDFSYLSNGDDLPIPKWALDAIKQYDESNRREKRDLKRSKVKKLKECDEDKEITLELTGS